MISFRTIFKEMLAERTRLLLTVLAIAWGTASISGMLAVGEGLRLAFGRAIHNSGRAVVLMRPGNVSIPQKGMPKGAQVVLTTQDITAMKKQVPTIKQLLVAQSFSAPIYYQKQSAFASPMAVTPGYGKVRALKPIKGGRFINALDMQQKKRVIFLGQEVVKWLFPHAPNPLGKTVFLGGWPFRVIGVMKPSMQFQGRVGNGVWIPLSTYRSLSGDQSFSEITLLPRHPSDVDQMEKGMLRVLATRHHYDPLDDQLLDFKNFIARQQKAQSVFSGMEWFLGIIGGLTLLVAGVGIANVMFMSVKKATRMIGVQMALGARYGHILCHYLTESLMVTLIGGTVGILFTQSMVYLFNLIPMRASFLQLLGKPRPVLSWLVLFSVIMTLGIIGFFAGFFPARQAASIDPAEALRQNG